MEREKEILSEITVFNKYAKFLPEQERRETWSEIVDRNVKMHLNKFPELENEIREAYAYVYDKRVLPSMRSLQFAGKAAEVNPARLYNCSFIAADDYRAFSEGLFLLLSGCGVGISVQDHHVEQLPDITKPNKNRLRRYVISDSIQGWGDAVKALMKSYFGMTTSRLIFDYSDIRPKGSLLVTSGGLAPGPQPLREALVKVEGILEMKTNGEKLTPIEVFDIFCHLADAVLSGGIRRAALITLFSRTNKEMLSAKSGTWWENNPQRGRSNNSAVLEHGEVSKEDFFSLWEYSKISRAGEPGFVWTNDKNLGVNPCFGGSERLLTDQGYRTFEELCDIGPINVVNKDGNITESKVWKSGDKETIKFKTTLGNTTVCTPDHVWMLNDGSECEAKDLSGKRLMPLLKTEHPEIKLFKQLGFIQGDGGLGRLKSPTHKGMEIHIGNDDSDILPLFGLKADGDKRSWYLNEFNDTCKFLQFDAVDLPYRKLPLTFNSWRRDEKLSFLKGLYSANGSVIKKHRVAFKSTCLPLIEQMQETLNDFGITSYYTTNKPKTVSFSNGDYDIKESYDLNISKYDSILQFHKLIGFEHKYKMKDLEDLIILKSPVINSVKQNGIEAVYDFTEPETHWGVVNGYIAHNCCEISLKSCQMCNLTEINVSEVESQEELNGRAWAASFIGTLQASYTDFYYLRDDWKRNCEKDALLGVSMTGVASMDVFDYNIKEAADIACATNEEVANKININKAARVTTLKPAGTTSLVVGSSSGIHAWHNDFYLRRMRINKTEALYSYLVINHPELIEDDYFDPDNTGVITVPQKAPEGAILRTESALELLSRVNTITRDWINPGYRSGANQHNVSCTVTVKDNEWNVVRNWMWVNRYNYTGLSILPMDTGTYTQTPFEDCTEEEYNRRIESLKSVDLTKVIETQNFVSFSAAEACSGGACEIK